MTNRFKTLKTDDITICSFIECLASVSDILEPFFLPYCNDCF